MDILSFIFEKGKLVSIYGEAGVGKTALALEAALRLRPSVFISTEGKNYEARLEKIRIGEEVYFASVNNNYELQNAILRAIGYRPRLLAVDTINSLYRINRDPLELLRNLVLLRSISRSCSKVLLLWQSSSSNRVAGEKLMRKLSDDVLRLTKQYIIGHLRRCKFKITDKGVIGCL